MTSVPESVVCGLVQDFSGAGLGLLGATNLKVFGAISKIYQSYYPELMGQCLISNAPMVMSLIYKGFSIFMDQGAHMCGRNSLHGQFTCLTALPRAGAQLLTSPIAEEATQCVGLR